jgi:hypothetical protein
MADQCDVQALRPRRTCGVSCSHACAVVSIRHSEILIDVNVAEVITNIVVAGTANNSSS